MKHSLKFFVLAVISMVAGAVSYAQVTTSSISGRITDKDGAVAGAAVMAVYAPTGATYYAVTDASGAYRINGITPGGPYTVTVDMLGYRKVENQGVYAPLGEAVVINSLLEDESLTLDAAVFIADATDSGMNIRRSGAGTAVSQKTMSALPSVSRSMNDVMKLTPQASSTTNGLAVGGGNYRSSYVTVDGAAFNNAFGIGSNLPGNGSPIALDALEQMSVNITPFDVRQSGFTGGAINAVTKSGSNDFHASVYNYYTSDSVRGYKVKGDDIPKSDFLDNTLGLTIGGPIIKNKLFFFVNGEYTWDNVPGSSKVVSTGTGRTGASFDPKDGAVVRPTDTFMNEVLDFLSDKYGYNPGRYQGYSLKTPDYKLMARLDWIINESNKLNVRFSHTHNYDSNSPSNSVNPIVPNPYDRNNYGRTSNYAQFFESNRYYQERNFTTFAAELNSRLSNKLSNMLRFTWSHQDEPRSFEGGNFPTVDIMEPYTSGDNTNNAVLTSFGPDPFTYGNLRDVQTYVATDELSIANGIHNFTLGAQFEYNNTKNGFMQGGLGYYVYDSWEDFKAGGKPAAFAITHSNRDDLAQVYPAFKYMQASWYAQDEVSISDYFKLTAGLRFELPIYPTIDGNENAEFLRLGAAGNTLSGHSTADMPKSRPSVSPRVGFNWDVLKDRSLILRGGAGIYTGRIPFVWIVSVAGNSNCLQAQYILPRGAQGTYPNFHDNVGDILKDIYGGTFRAQDLAAPTGATIIDKNLSMPTTVKASLAADVRLPWGIKGTIEGIYNKDIQSVASLRLGYVQNKGGLQLPGEPKARDSWRAENVRNSQNGAVAPYYLTNKTLDGKSLPKGYYYSVTAQLSKDFNWGLSLMAAYTRSASKSIQEGYGDQVSSLFSGGNYAVNGSNQPELGNSAFVSPNRLIANASWRIQEGKNLATTIGLFYEGYNHCFIGNYSYTRYSYVLGKLTGEGGSNNLMFIPTDAQLGNMEFSSEDNKAAFKAFLASDSYTKNHRGEYSTRGAKVAPWQGRFNLKVAQDISCNIAGRTNTLQIGVDILNLGNLINSDWGLSKQISTENILNYSGGKYTFTEPTKNNYKNTFSTWQMLLSAKLFF